MKELRSALVGQYRAALATLRQEIELCPEDLWTAGKHPRAFWRIAYHTLFYTHLYLMPSEEDFVPWDRHREHAPALWVDEDGPPVEEPYSRAELLSYLDFIYGSVEAWVERLDLTSQDPGFHWYTVSKLDHQLLNVRHIGGHVGQLSELLMARGIDVDWVSKR